MLQKVVRNIHLLALDTFSPGSFFTETRTVCKVLQNLVYWVEFKWVPYLGDFQQCVHLICSGRECINVFYSRRKTISCPHRWMKHHTCNLRFT